MGEIYDMRIEDLSIGKLHAKNLHNWARFGRLMVCRKIANFQDLKAIATGTARVNQFSKFNMPRVGKRKGYQKNSEIFFLPPTIFFLTFANFFFRKQKKLIFSI